MPRLSPELRNALKELRKRRLPPDADPPLTPQRLSAADRKALRESAKLRTKNRKELKAELHSAATNRDLLLQKSKQLADYVSSERAEARASRAERKS